MKDRYIQLEDAIAVVREICRRPLEEHRFHLDAVETEHNLCAGLEEKAFSISIETKREEK